jgi:hypothetical protein
MFNFSGFDKFQKDDSLEGINVLEFSFQYLLKSKINFKIKSLPSCRAYS